MFGGKDEQSYNHAFRCILKKIGLPRVNITIREAWEGHQVKLSIYNSQPSVIDPNHI